MRFTSPSIKKFIPLSLLLVLVGCKSIGTYLLPKNIEGFNSAMVSSEEQQVLLNIVRLRFDDRPYFLSVDSITTSNSFSMSGGGSYSNSPSHNSSSSDSLSATSNGLASVGQILSKSFSMSNSLSFSPSASYSDSPTVSFTPLQGEKFTRHLLSPIDVPTISIILESGVSAHLLFRLVMYKVGDLDNLSDIFMTRPPKIKPFLELITLLRELQVDDMIYFQDGVITEISAASNNVRRMRHSEMPGQSYNHQNDQ